MAFNDLFQVYPNRNQELRTLCKTLYGFGANIGKEPSANLPSGMNEHALKRQESYVAYAKTRIETLYSRPIPDHPATHPINFDISLDQPYTTYMTDVNGTQVPLNEETQLLMEKWMLAAVELAKSSSASIDGSLLDHDHERAVANIEVIEKIIAEMKDGPLLDLPEEPEADAPLESGETSSQS